MIHRCGQWVSSWSTLSIYLLLFSLITGIWRCGSTCSSRRCCAWSRARQRRTGSSESTRSFRSWIWTSARRMWLGCSGAKAYRGARSGAWRSRPRSWLTRLFCSPTSPRVAWTRSWPSPSWSPWELWPRKAKPSFAPFISLPRKSLRCLTSCTHLSVSSPWICDSLIMTKSAVLDRGLVWVAGQVLAYMLGLYITMWNSDWFSAEKSWDIIWNLIEFSWIPFYEGHLTEISVYNLNRSQYMMSMRSQYIINEIFKKKIS